MHRDRAAYPPRDHFRRLALASETEDRTSGTQQPRATGPRRWPHPHPRIPRHRRPRQPHYVLQCTAHSGCRGARPRFRAGTVHGRQTSPPFRPNQGQPGHRHPRPRPQPARLEADHGPTTADHPDRRGQPANLRVITVTKGDRTTDVPVPSVLGSLILKAVAYHVDSRDRDRHAADAASLVSLITDPLNLAGQLKSSDRKRLRILNALIGSRSHPLWASLGAVANNAHTTWQPLNQENTSTS